MGLFDKLAFWKKDDFSDMDFNKPMPDPMAGQQSNDPLAELSKDPMADMGQDPFNSTDPFSGGGAAGSGNQMPQRQNPPVNEIGVGSAQGKSPYDSVTQMPTNDPYNQRPNQSIPQAGMDKDIEIISAKIDTIRVSVENLGHKIENLTQRLAEIEKIAKQEQTEEVKW